MSASTRLITPGSFVVTAFDMAGKKKWERNVGWRFHQCPRLQCLPDFVSRTSLSSTATTTAMRTSLHWIAPLRRATLESAIAKIKRAATSTPYHPHHRRPRTNDPYPAANPSPVMIRLTVQTALDHRRPHRAVCGIDGVQRATRVSLPAVFPSDIFWPSAPTDAAMSPKTHIAWRAKKRRGLRTLHPS